MKHELQTKRSKSIIFAEKHIMESFKDIIRSSTPTLIDFHATWCGPCKVMSPILEELKNDFKGKLRILKIDVDKNQAVAAKYKVRGVPTFVLFKEGEIQFRFSGAVSKQEFASKLQPFL